MDAISENPVVPSFPPTQPPDMLLPHMQQFAAVFKTPARTYRWTFDEALKRSRTDALAMRRDGHILHLLQARYLPLLGAEWCVASDDLAMKPQATTYQQLIEKIPRLLQMRKYLLEAVWYGRSGVQIVPGPVNVAGRQMTGITAWKPVNGDKISFREDGTPCIRINPAFASKLRADGATVMDVRELNDIVSWSDLGTVLVLDKPAWRQRFLIHVHEIEDADYTEPELAGGVGGVGLRHYCYWIWWLRQEMMEWLLTYLELVGAGGITIVYYDASNPKGLEMAQSAFAERATVAFLPKPAGSEQQTNMIQRIEPSGMGNDIFRQWIEDYFNGVLTKLIIGQDLSSQSAATGLGSGVADLQASVKECIHRYDAKNLNETETQQLLNTLIQLNEPQALYPFRCVTTMKTADPEKAMAAANTAWQMGAVLPESYILSLANVPEVKEGERTLSLAQQQMQEQAIAATMPPDPADSGGGESLEDMRGTLTEQGVPEEEQLHTIADMVDDGELLEVDSEGGVRYLNADEVARQASDTPSTYAKADWTEAVGPRGARYWTNSKTGTVQYREPRDREPAKAKTRESDSGQRATGTPQKGVATKGAYESLDRALRGESSKTLAGDGVLRHVMDADKRLLKAQVISIASQHGMTIDSRTSKTRALAFIEDKLREHAGGKSDGQPVPEKQAESAAQPVAATASDQQPAPEQERVSRRERSPAGSGAGTPAVSETRTAGQPLKEYLSGMGAESVHNDIANYAKMLHAQAKEETWQHNEIVKRGAELITGLSGKKFTSAHPALKTGDYNSIDAFDVAHQSLHSEFPDRIPEGKQGMEKLMVMLQEGTRSTPKLREFEEQALAEWHEAGRPMPESDSQEFADTGDTSFDFGANLATGKLEEERSQWEKYSGRIKQMETKLTPQQLEEKWFGKTTTASSSTSGMQSATSPPVAKVISYTGHDLKKKMTGKASLSNLVPEKYEEPVIDLKKLVKA